MSNILFEAEATTSVEPVSLLEQLDPPSPVLTITDLLNFPEPEGIYLAEELENSSLTDFFDNSEDETLLSAPSGSRDDVSCRFQGAAESPLSSVTDSKTEDEAASVALPLPIENAFEQPHMLFDAFFDKDNVQYYRDMRSLYPVGDLSAIYRDQYHLFYDMQPTLFETRLTPRPNPRFLEAGCGAGYWAKSVAHINPEIRVWGIDSTCLGIRRDDDPLNYYFLSMDLVNTTPSLDWVTGNTDPFDLNVRGTFDHIRCTRMNGRVNTWLDWCNKMYSYAKNGANIEVYDVLPNHATKAAEYQPTWAMVPVWYKEFSRMGHMPYLRAREWADCDQIEQSLGMAGFTCIKTTERRERLKTDDVDASRHIESLVFQAICIAHQIGVPVGHLSQYQDMLRYEASQFGVEVKSFTICAKKGDHH